MSSETEAAPQAPDRNATVTLREITGDTVRDITSLKTTQAQETFVAPNAISIAEAYFNREKAWFRAIYADETPVGFVMLYDSPEEEEYYLWRYMIDQRYQRMGFGRQALSLVVDYVKSRPSASNLDTSYVPGEGSPGEFYHKFGFIDTGEVEHDELVTRLPL